MNSVIDVKILLLTGCPIQKSPDLNLFSGSPELIAASHVFHRLLAPRHPPYALCSLTINRTSQRNLIPDYSIVKEQIQSEIRNNALNQFSILYSRFQLPLVEVSGFEPLTPCVQGRCSPSWAIPPLIIITWNTIIGNLALEKKVCSRGIKIPYSTLNFLIALFLQSTGHPKILGGPR